MASFDTNIYTETHMLPRYRPAKKGEACEKN
jgi:hypothetical protein